MSPGDIANLVMAVSVISTIALAYGFIRFMNAWTAKYSRRDAQPTVHGHDADAIARIQASVDAISIEVERISEGQRFTARLLNERVELSKIAAPERSESAIGQ